MVDAQLRSELLIFMLELVDQKTQAGSWHGEAPTLQSIVITCQAVQFIAAFHGDIAKDAADAGCRWLTRPDVVASEYSYQRLEPLIACNASAADISDAREACRRVIVAGLLHHPKSPLRRSYVASLIQMGISDEQSDAIIDGWLSEAVPDEPDWSAGEASHLLVLLEKARSPLDATLEQKLVRAVRTKGTLAGSARYWSSLVETAYTTMNLVQYGAIAKTPLANQCRGLAEEGLRHLCRAWLQQDFSSPPVAGGDFDGTLYSRLVVARALGRSFREEDPAWEAEAWANHFATSRLRPASAVTPTTDGVALRNQIEGYRRSVRGAACALGTVLTVVAVYLAGVVHGQALTTILISVGALGSVGTARLVLMDHERLRRYLTTAAAIIALIGSIASVVAVFGGANAGPPPQAPGQSKGPSTR